MRFTIIFILTLLILPGVALRAENAVSPRVAALQAKAEQGDAKAQNNLGLLYMRGTAVALDYNQAAGWYRKAADQGNEEAQNNLGTLYLNGQGVPKSIDNAVSWFRKAAEQGEEVAQYNLAQLLLGGQGVSSNEEEAYYWLILSSRSGKPRHVALRDKIAASLRPERAAAIQDKAKIEAQAPAQTPVEKDHVAPAAAAK